MVQQASPLIDFAESPQDNSEPAGGNDSVIEHESWSKLVVPPVIVSRERPFKARSRANVIALEPASYDKDVPFPTRSWQSGRVLGITQYSYRSLAHWREDGHTQPTPP